MIRSLNTGVQGLKQYQTSLDAIGNNLANINTVAFKSARVDFQDTLNQTLRAPTPDTESVSGSTGMQVGNGLSISAIKNSFQQGAIKQTGVRTDLGITGDGFFLVKDAATNELFATRAGDFRVDKNGFLVTNGGHRVQGLDKQAPAYTAAEKSQTGDLQITTGKYIADVTGVGVGLTNERQVDSYKTFAGASGDGDNFVVTVNGNNVSAVTMAADNEATIDALLTAINGDSTVSTLVTASKSGAGAGAKLLLTAATAGTPIATSITANDGVTATVTTAAVTKEAAGAGLAVANETDNAITKTDHGYSTGMAVKFSGTVPTASPAITTATVMYVRTNAVTPDDMFTLHATASDAAANTNAIDFTAAGLAGGYTLVGGASISSYSFGQDGKINMLLNDGTSYVRGQLLLQNFKNTQNLMKSGQNLYSNIATAGAMGTSGDSASATQILAAATSPGASGLGTIQSGSLELSNVDMAKEFANMITTQRAFQANARVISTSDEILQEMMQLKR